MRPVVAIVAARPETILEDYRRAMDLAQLGGSTAQGEPVLAVTSCRGRWVPGFASPPWQLDGVLAALAALAAANAAPNAAANTAAGRAVLPAGDPIPVVPVGAAGARERLSDPAHEAVLRRHGAAWTQEPVGPLLERRSLILLPVPALAVGGRLSGATALLNNLLRAAGPARSHPRRRTGQPLAPAALAVMAQGILPRLAVVMDGIVWGAGAGTLHQGPIQRNVVLAGDDPVAVDAVAMTLAGLDPQRASGLRPYAEAGLGICDLDGIRVVGHVELLDEPFPSHRHPGHAGRRTWPGPRLQTAAWRLLKRPRILREHATTAWGRLAGEYRQGPGPEQTR